MSRKHKIEPRKIRKHSDIVREHTNPTLISGDRVETKTGFRVPGTACEDYETFFEVILDGGATDKVAHSKKTRSVRALTGQGIAFISKDNVTRSVTLMPGDEIVLSPGIEYRIASMPRTSLEIFVTQSAGYETELQVLEETEESVKAPAELLEPVSREQVLEHNLVPQAPRTRRSKAAEQQRAKAVSMGKVAPTVEGPVVTEGINARPSMGNFDVSGAG